MRLWGLLIWSWILMKALFESIIEAIKTVRREQCRKRIWDSAEKARIRNIIYPTKFGQSSARYGDSDGMTFWIPESCLGVPGPEGVTLDTSYQGMTCLGPSLYQDLEDNPFLYKRFTERQ